MTERTARNDKRLWTPNDAGVWGLNYERARSE